ncbi:MAG: acyl-CoA synthetase [Hyphomicrobiaceae bacterium]|nr:acyl-CoA synthetase [Hyphomicrobiaceae bacterium]
MRHESSTSSATQFAKQPANYVPLSPVSFLARTAAVYPKKTAIIDGRRRFDYAAFYERCRRLASALTKRGIGYGDTVAIMAPNITAMLEAHFAVPAIGAVLNSLNVRLDGAAIAFCLNHGDAKFLITDREFSDTIKVALKQCDNDIDVIDIDDPEYDGGENLGTTTYEELLEEGDPEFAWSGPRDEWDSMSLLYTSGTTGDPKGVLYHHRGAYLNTLGNAMVFGLDLDSVYLWTLPMFHCDGWTFPWAVTAVGGMHVCLRRVDPALIFPLIKQHRVSHMIGAPIVLNMLVNAPEEVKTSFDWTVECATGGASPPSTIISAMEEMGFRITHLYGATEAYGPATVCAYQPGWEEMSSDCRAAKLARQGVRYPVLEDVMVADPVTLEPVPRNAETMGEVLLRGNTVMKGYLKNASATESALGGGWYHTGDLGVWHEDGYVEIKDRSKDIIISGGENISSLEVEETLYRHPRILEAAVVAKSDEKWGETPCAFVTLKDGTNPTEEEIIEFCRANMAHFKCPTEIIFGPLPKTATGKIQKFRLREQANGAEKTQTSK